MTVDASRRPGLASVAIIGATAVWGATFVTVKDALGAADAYSFLALRFALGALAAGLLSLLWQRPAHWSRGFRPGLVLGVFLFGGYLLQTLGLKTTTPARSAFITGLTVLFVPFVSWMLSGHRPRWRAFAAPVVALAGLQWLTGMSWNDPVPPGDLLTLGCSVLYAWHIALTSRVGQGVPPMVLTTVQLAVVSLLSLLGLPWADRHFEPTLAFWCATLFTGVVASALAIGVQVWAQKQITAVRAAVIYSLEPVFALAWAAGNGQGWPSSQELIGGGFILGAVLISEVEIPGQ